MHSPRHRPDPRAALLADERWLRGLCRRLAADEGTAEDLGQEVWLALLRRPPRETTPIRSWAAGVLARLAAREHRRRYRAGAAENADHVDPLLDDEPGLEQRVERYEARERLAAALRDLPAPYGATLAERYVHGRTPKEIAHAAGVPGGTIRARLARGRELLRDRLDEDSLLPELGTLAVIATLLRLRGPTPLAVAGSSAAAVAASITIALATHTGGAPPAASHPEREESVAYSIDEQVAEALDVAEALPETEATTADSGGAVATSTSWGTGSSTSWVHFSSSAR